MKSHTDFYVSQEAKEKIAKAQTHPLILFSFHLRTNFLTHGRVYFYVEVGFRRVVGVGL
jgi:hypothetical protein